jgi:hypothetical protein
MNTERMICGKVIEALLKAGFAVGLNDGVDTTVKATTDGSEVLAAIQTTEEDYILAYKDGKQVGWAWFVWGNGEEALTDYTVNLEEVLKPVFDWIEAKS